MIILQVQVSIFNVHVVKDDFRLLVKCVNNKWKHLVPTRANTLQRPKTCKHKTLQEAQDVF